MSDVENAGPLHADGILHIRGSVLWEAKADDSVRRFG
jgi:hypothetical protein